MVVAGEGIVRGRSGTGRAKRIISWIGAGGDDEDEDIAMGSGGS